MKTQDQTIRKNQKVFNDTLASSHLHTYKEPIMLDMELATVEPGHKPSKIFILNEDLIDTAHEVVKQGVLPLLVYSLDNCGPYNKAEAGSTVYECELYRRTNIAAVRERVFPLEDRMVLYPGLTVFKSSMYETCDPFTIAVLGAVPVVTPPVISIVGDTGTQLEYQNKADYEKMRNVIRCIFNIAADYEYKCIIIRDFGCDPGTDNPINIVCDIFNEAISEYKIPLVIFCIQPPAYAKNLKKQYENHVYFHEHITR